MWVFFFAINHSKIIRMFLLRQMDHKQNKKTSHTNKTKQNKTIAIRKSLPTMTFHHISVKNSYFLNKNIYGILITTTLQGECFQTLHIFLYFFLLLGASAHFCYFHGMLLCIQVWTFCFFPKTIMHGRVTFVSSPQHLSSCKAPCKIFGQNSIIAEIGAC